MQTARHQAFDWGGAADFALFQGLQRNKRIPFGVGKNKCVGVTASNSLSIGATLNGAKALITQELKIEKIAQAIEVTPCTVGNYLNRWLRVIGVTQLKENLSG